VPDEVASIAAFHAGRPRKLVGPWRRLPPTKNQVEKNMSEDRIERRAALMIKDFVRVHGGGEMPIDDYIPMIAATLAGRDTGCVNPADIDFNLTMLPA
jgi:hypothetical protein